MVRPQSRTNNRTWVDSGFLASGIGRVPTCHPQDAARPSQKEMVNHGFGQAIESDTPTSIALP